MSHSKEPAKDLAPQAVEFVPLLSLGRRNSGTAMTAAKMKTIRAENGPVRIFAGGQNVADVSEDAIPPQDVIREPSIIVKSRGNIGFSFYERPFTHKAELWSYTLSDPRIDQKYVFYYLLTQVKHLQVLAGATSVKIPQLSVRDTDALHIPVPPLEVQHEIVRILDSFTELEAELEAKLEAELEARRRQHEYHRDLLLSPTDTESQTVPLGGLVASVSSGRNKSRIADGDVPVFGSTGLIGYTDVANYSGESLLIARVGANAGLVSAVSGDYDVSDNTIIITPKAQWDIRFAFHQLVHMNINQFARGGGQPLITGAQLKSLLVWLPSLQDQRRIAATLDNFDALVNNLSIGLPAELAARRKQYEYYRDKLLTFEEAPA